MKKTVISLCVLFFATLLFFAFRSRGIDKSKFKDGDIIFQVNQSGQGKAVQLATGSKFTHVGIVFIENGEPVVYHAVQPVKKSMLRDFVSMGEQGFYEVKRLKNRDKELDSTEIKKMKASAQAMLGKNYDIYFNWGDDQIYCSEFVWKIYKQAAGIEVGPLKCMKEFNLESKEVKAIMKQRYGDKLPLDEKMISPGDMFTSPLLESVK